LVAKSFLYLAAALNMVLLPVVAALRAKGQDAEGRAALLKFLVAALGIELLGLALVWLATPWVIRFLCGSEPAFLDLAPLVRVFSAAVLPLALAQLLIYYLLACRDYRSLWLCGGVTLGYTASLQWGAFEGPAVPSRLALAAGALLLGGLMLAFAFPKPLSPRLA
jgi:O-antigen/teichoic acid export membrane protein